MAEAAPKLTGTERAAILLLTLGEQEAAEVLRHMGPKEVQKVGAAMAGMANVSRDSVSTVLDDFVDTIENETALGVGSEDYIRKVMTEALGEDKAGGLIDRILMGRNSKGLEALKWMDSRAVGEIIRLEHPQIIAIVLSYLDADHAAGVLATLPERDRPAILMRIASLDGLQPNALKELDEILEKQFAGQTNVKSSSVGGIKSAADILNFLDGNAEQALLDEVREVDPDLSQQIQDSMFVFDNLIDVDDRGIQSLLREVSSESLILALKAADETMREKFFKNMSKRAGEMLRDDLEAKGPVKLSEVEQSQKEILAIARRMADAGELSLGGGGDEYV
ncbi:flagellar motor switch protein FliG [Solemya pervernicosa gill symbiont]|uniref:Flagellar motor switch protein FliG n=1 Tax=Solemya pervernicosa gill symbiont TaxID=642797 RepID=A0A1T2LAK0_9GAMM|nr:flagellar motor switch protein FliG [Solemya pervernicosa gill symbiont]OOZ42125.1 flagellar motor switch protein FliG [Solemya pervernicosa gill symbiont]